MFSLVILKQIIGIKCFFFFFKLGPYTYEYRAKLQINRSTRFRDINYLVRKGKQMFPDTCLYDIFLYFGSYNHILNILRELQKHYVHIEMVKVRSKLNESVQSVVKNAY